MRIDQSHRSWAYGTIVAFGVALVLYIPYALVWPGGPRGNTVPGLIYGSLGYAMMLFAGLKGARKKVPAWRIGRAQTWMRGHLWLGALSLPMILFHAAFRAGGPLTLVLMILLFVAVLSGITGAVIQHMVPRMIMSSVPLETIFEQIPHVREKLREEANAIFTTLCAAADSPDSLRFVYTGSILPFLRDPEAHASPLTDPLKSRALFDALRKQSPSEMHHALGNLEGICEEERQLTRQSGLYYWLHGWLLVHVPVSVTLLVLGGVHAFVAIHY